MLKEKIRGLKQKNADLVGAIKELQERIRLLEEKAFAREKSITSDSRDDIKTDMRLNDPFVYESNIKGYKDNNNH
jgi:hypothetical protein